MREVMSGEGNKRADRRVSDSPEDERRDGRRAHSFRNRYEGKLPPNSPPCGESSR
jgi:hypothetical protein